MPSKRTLHQLWPVIALAVILAATIQGDWEPADGHIMHEPQLPEDGGATIASSAATELADDWVAPIRSQIRDIHFWGAWEAGNVGIIDSFRIRIYDDAPVEPPLPYKYTIPHLPILDIYVDPSEYAVMGPFSNTWDQTWYDPASDSIAYDDHTGYYLYNVFLDQSDYVIQELGETYWLSIYAFVRDTAQPLWGWMTTDDIFASAAVAQGFTAKSWQTIERPGYNYIHGDVDGNTIVNLSDVIYLSNYVNSGGPAPMCYLPQTAPLYYPCADIDGDCDIDNFDVACYGDPECPKNYCPAYPPPSGTIYVDLAFVINGTCCLTRGDINHDNLGPDIADLVFLVNYMFNGGPVPQCDVPLGSGYYAEADIDGNLLGPDIADLVYLVNYMFNGGPAPVPCP
ncbi:MAG: hypothetical protein ABIE70_12580 [bacterium]